MLNPLLKYLAVSEQTACNIEEMIESLGHKRVQSLRLFGKKWIILILTKGLYHCNQKNFSLLICPQQPHLNQVIHNTVLPSSLPNEVSRTGINNWQNSQISNKVSQTEENSQWPTSIIFLRICLNRSVKASDFFFSRLRPVWAPFKRAFMMVWALLNKWINNNVLHHLKGLGKNCKVFWHRRN